jgi:hypothetical protein
MAGTYGAYKTDEGREREGVTLDLGEAGKFKLARAGGANTQFEKRLMAATKPYRRAIQTGNIEKKLADRLLAEAYRGDRPARLGRRHRRGREGSRSAVRTRSSC